MSTPKSTFLRRSGARSRPVAALVTGVALAAALAGCSDDGGDDGGDTATDPGASASSSTPSDEPSSEPTSSTPESGSGSQTTIPATGSAGITEATLLSQTEGGGSASTLAFALDTDQAVSDFIAQFDGSFNRTVSDAATQVAQQHPDATAYGATVSVGCQAPRSVTIDAGEAGFEVIAKIPKDNVQCLAPMTYVVLFAAPNA
jgi:hypothetical protein